MKAKKQVFVVIDLKKKLCDLKKMNVKQLSKKKYGVINVLKNSNKIIY
jgi:hypothetical protein